MSNIFKNFIFAIGCCFGYQVFAAADNLATGAKQAAMGNAAVACSDIWSVYHNQAGLAGIEKPTASIYTSQGYLLKPTTQAAAAFAYPTKLGVFAFSFNRFGFKLFNESKTGVAFARKFGELLRFGVQANINSINIGDNYYGKKSLLTFEAGIQTKLLKNLWLGAHIYNISRTKVNEIEKVPIMARFGLFYTFNTSVNVTIEYEKNWTNKPLYKAGLEYKLAKEFALRVGINGGASVGSFVGAGYKIKRFSVDAACGFNQKLGTSPHLSLTYIFE